MAGKTPRNEKSLVCFIQALVGTTVVVECRDDVAIRGNLEHCDDDMHRTLTNAIRVTPEGYKSKLERVYAVAHDTFRPLRSEHQSVGIHGAEEVRLVQRLETLRGASGVWPKKLGE